MDSFAQVVIHEFAFLIERKFLYRVKNDDQVKFFKRGLEISLVLSRYSLEISCYYKLCWYQEIDLCDVIRELNLPYVGLYQLHTINDYPKGIRYIARVVEETSEQAINNKSFLKHISKKNKKIEKEIFMKDELRRADIFWKNKELNAAVEIYEKYYTSLTALQKKRVKYKRKLNK